VREEMEEWAGRIRWAGSGEMDHCGRKRKGMERSQWARMKEWGLVLFFLFSFQSFTQKSFQVFQKNF
jgi:hypothetical protein